ncbi:hypothetical protein AN958_07845, partial [Leucoagaricus sp. SymC.cos]
IMVWVSNRSPAAITVSITNTTGGSASDYTVSPSVSLGPAGDAFKGVKKETRDNNYWVRRGAETLKVEIGGKELSFRVQKDDHVIFYADAYEIFASAVTQF